MIIHPWHNSKAELCHRLFIYVRENLAERIKLQFVVTSNESVCIKRGHVELRPIFDHPWAVSKNSVLDEEVITIGLNFDDRKYQFWVCCAVN